MNWGCIVINKHLKATKMETYRYSNLQCIIILGLSHQFSKMCNLKFRMSRTDINLNLSRLYFLNNQITYQPQLMTYSFIHEKSIHYNMSLSYFNIRKSKLRAEYLLQISNIINCASPFILKWRCENLVIICLKY